MKIKKATARMMMNQQVKWRKQAEKPAKWNEGYAGVTYADVWNLNDRLASIIARHLHAFLKATKGPHGDVQPFCTMVTRMKPINAGYRLFAI